MGRKIERKATRERMSAQELVRKRFSKGKINAARKRLCYCCTRRETCALLPLMTTGDDCMYFDEKVKSKETEDGNI